MDLEELNREIVVCRRCPRLVKWREAIAARKRKAYQAWEYWGRPVPGFGDAKARVLVVGLAPGAHGSNRTGRQFTGDASGLFLYPALYRAGFANQPTSISRDDGLQLRGMYLTASVRCAPPDNKPTPLELARCQPYLTHEIELISPKVIVCLGRIAFERLRRIFALRGAGYRFSHGATYRIHAPATGLEAWLVCSYHPSQQNTLTGRLSARMFDRIWSRTRELSDRD